METFTRQLTSVAQISGWRRSPAGAIGEIRRIQLRGERRWNLAILKYRNSEMWEKMEEEDR